MIAVKLSHTIGTFLSSIHFAHYDQKCFKIAFLYILALHNCSYIVRPVGGNVLPICIYAVMQLIS